MMKWRHAMGLGLVCVTVGAWPVCAAERDKLPPGEAAPPVLPRPSGEGRTRSDTAVPVFEIERPDLISADEEKEATPKLEEIDPNRQPVAPRMPRPSDGGLERNVMPRSPRSDPDKLPKEPKAPPKIDEPGPKESQAAPSDPPPKPPQAP